LKKGLCIIILLLLSLSLFGEEIIPYGISINFSDDFVLSPDYTDNYNREKYILWPTDKGYLFNKSIEIEYLDGVFDIDIYGLMNIDVIPVEVKSKSLVEGIFSNEFNLNITAFGDDDEQAYVTNKTNLLDTLVAISTSLMYSKDPLAFCDFEKLETNNGVDYLRSYSLGDTSAEGGLVSECFVYRIPLPEGYLFSEIIVTMNELFLNPQYRVPGQKNNIWDYGYQPKYNDIIYTYINGKSMYYAPDDPDFLKIKDSYEPNPLENITYYTMTTEDLASFPNQSMGAIKVMKAMDEAMSTLQLIDPPSSSILGEVNDNLVRVRSDYNLTSDTLGHVNTGEEVIILDRSDMKQKIGNMNDYWYKIISKDSYLRGWMYGAFLDLK
jgi:hypothetical protein